MATIEEAVGGGVSFALTEEQKALRDLAPEFAEKEIRPKERGDEYVLNGSKMFITNAGHAAWLTVFASTDKSKGHRGLTAFIVPTDLDGVIIEKHLDKMGQRSTDTSALAFQDVKVPAANRIGAEG